MISAGAILDSAAVVQVVMVPPWDSPIMPMRPGSTAGRVSNYSNFQEPTYFQHCTESAVGRAGLVPLAFYDAQGALTPFHFPRQA